MAHPPLSLSLALHLIISLSSLSCACVAGFYVHPFLLPILTSSVPRLGSAIGAHLTHPILFLLLNLLLVALFVTSNMKTPGKTELARKDGDDDHDVRAGMPNNDADDQAGKDAVWVAAAGAAQAAGKANNDLKDDCGSIFLVDDICSDDVDFKDAVSNDDILPHTVPCNNVLPDVKTSPQDIENCHSQHPQPQLPGRNNVLRHAEKSPQDKEKCHSQQPQSRSAGRNNVLRHAEKLPQEREKCHSQPQPQSAGRKSGKNRTCLERSRSDGIIVLGAMGLRKTPSELRPIRRLKKAGTFESTWRRRRVKPVVVVADPPEDGRFAEEEVDKKAEDFIGKFYQRIRLQR